MAELYRILKARLDRSDKQLDELIGKVQTTNQRVSRLQYGAQQLRLATEVEVNSDTKTRKRTGGATGNRAKHGDSSSAKVGEVPTSWTSFGIIAKPLLAPEKCTSNVLVTNGAKALKPHLPTREGAHATIRYLWLNAHRHYLYNAEDHISPTASFKKKDKYSSATICRLNFNQLASPS